MFAVIDLETTGLWPQRSDRIVEVAIVRLDGELAVIEAWTTLVNPERDVGPVRLHGITASDVIDAPTFGDLAAAVADRISGCVLVSHNLPFDSGFLRAEFLRVGHELPSARGLCTLAMARDLDLPGGRALSNCCASLGLGVRPDHSALADAEAAAELFRYCVADRRRRGVELPPHEPFPLVLLPAASTNPRSVPRRSGSARPVESPLQQLLDRLPQRAAAVEAGDAAVAAYADLLDRALEDRRVTAHEVDVLADTARAWALTQEAVNDIHRSYLTGLVGVALADRQLTAVERTDLERVAGLLGLGAELPALVSAAESPSMSLGRPTRSQEFSGKSVCFTGESLCSVGGSPLAREQQELLAAQAGLIVAPRVTRKLDILVLSDPESMSGKARTARSYGTRLIAERAFWAALGVAID